MIKAKKSVIVYSLLLVCIITFWVVRVVYLEGVKNNAKYTFTIVEISDYYHQGNVNGKEVIYYFNDRQIVGHCSSMKCKRAKIGDRFLIKVFESDPEVFEIVFDFKIKRGVVSPRGGWKTLPPSSIRSM